MQKIFHQLPEDAKRFLNQHPDVVASLVDFMEHNPVFEPIMGDLIRSYLRIVDCFERGGRLFVCGNGGSFADSLHISAEMMKSFQRRRGLRPEDREKFLGLPDGEILAGALEYGLPVIVLGLNHSLRSAVENDISVPGIGFAQELFALGKTGDVLLGISTSGNAQNVCYAVTTARALGMHTIALTGYTGGKLASMVEIAIRVPASSTHRIQELHLQVYHTLCAVVEAHFFHEGK